MKCSSCGVDIPPAWKAVYAKNECPNCNGQIMNDAMQELIHELGEAMQKLPNDSFGLAGWLVSNYSLKKIGTGALVNEFYDGKKARPPADESNLKIAGSAVDAFMKRTDVANKLEGIKIKAEQAKNGKIAQLAQSIQDIEGAEDNPAPEIEADEEDVKTMQALAKAGVNPFGDSTPAALANVGRKAMTAAEIQALQELTSESTENMMGAGGDDDYLPDEKILMRTEKGRRVVLENRLKRIKAQEAVMSGGGSFRRSGG